MLKRLKKSSLSVNYTPHLSSGDMELATLTVVKVVQLQSFPDLIHAVCKSSAKGDTKSAHVSKQWGKLYPLCMMVFYDTSSFLSAFRRFGCRREFPLMFI